MAIKFSPAWLILIAVLAVPGFLFYNWHARLNHQSTAELRRGVRRSLPNGEPIFGDAPDQARLRNPIVAATQAAAAQLRRPAQPAQPARRSVKVSVPAPSAPPAPERPPARKPASVPQTMSVVSATPATPASPAAPDFSVELPRDPMLSPADRLELAQAEALRRSGGRRAKRPSQRVRRRRELTGAERVELQGIIAIKGGGGRAIVNGQTVAAGDTIAGVKVLKITQSEVVFSYRNKRFIKSVGK